MNIFSKIFGSGVREAATGIADVIDRFVETSDEKRAAETLLKKIEQEPDKWQAEINRIEAAHPSVFVSGYRPAIGWICAMALFWNWILSPVLKLFFDTVPDIVIEHPMALVYTLLGVGGMRTWEKFRGVARN